MNSRKLLHRLIEELPAEEPLSLEVLQQLLREAIARLPPEPDSVASEPPSMQSADAGGRGARAARLIGLSRKYSPERDAVADLVAARAAEG